MSWRDEQEQEELNESRFLVEELNLDEQPTEEEVLERAEELGIDDLIMARESLTKELGPEWKPYCNRHSDIYYINLEEQLAYQHHPIDMFYQKEYAAMNGLPTPRFPSFRVDEVARSLDLVQEEIRNFRTRTHRNPLRIVYEEPSEEEALSSHPKSPYADQQPHQAEEGQLSLEELDSLNEYERELEAKYEQAYQRQKKQARAGQRERQQRHDALATLILERRVEEILERCEDEVGQKNRLDWQKQIGRVEADYQAKMVQFCDSIHRFSSTFEKLHQKQRDIAEISQGKTLLQKMTAVENLKRKAALDKLQAGWAAAERMRREFGQKLVSMHPDPSALAGNLQREIKQLQRPVPPSRGQTGRKRIFRQMPSSRLPDTDLEYQELKRQIRELCLWGREDGGLGNQPAGRAVPSLNLRLHMRIL